MEKKKKKTEKRFCGGREGEKKNCSFLLGFPVFYLGWALELLFLFLFSCWFFLQEQGLLWLKL